MGKIFLFALICFLSFSCVEEIPFDLEETNAEFLIIDAEIRDTDLSHEISIKINSAESTDFRPDLPVNDAEVYIIENENDEFRFLSANEQGIYINNSLRPQFDNTYQLIVEYKGTRYSSAIERLNRPMGIDSSYTLNLNDQVTNSAGNVVSENIIELYANANFPVTEEVYVRYRVNGTFEYREISSPSNLNPVTCFVEDLIDLDNISLASNQEQENGEIRNQLIIRESADYRFSTGYCFKIYSERISKNAYEFWKLVENEFNRTGDIFEKPPGILRGNIIEETDTDISSVGLFSMISSDLSYHRVFPVDASSPRPQCTPFPRGPETCFNCLLLPNSTLIRPECF